MKKTFLFVLSVLCLSAVQAVTLAWSGEDLTNTSNITTESPYHDGSFVYGANSQFSVLASFTTSASGVLFAFGQGQNLKDGNYNNSIRVEVNANKKLNLIYQGGNTTNGAAKTIEVGTEIETGEEHKIAYALERAANNATSTLDIYFDGNKIASVSVLASTWSGPVNAYKVSDGVTVDLSVYGGVLTEEEGIAWTTPGVPEPTALALLALGVAGLSLRRRAA